MLSRVLLLVTLTSCRLHFDEVRTEPGDATDAPAGACVAEQCNGLDDNCDGAIDEGCGCTPFDVTIPSTVNTAGLALAWTGAGYLMTARTGAGWATLTISPDGVVGTPRPVAGNTDIAQGTSSVWTGSEHLVGYYESSAAYVLRLDADGAPIGAPVRVDDTGASSPPILARRNNDAIGIAWMTGASTGGMREIDRTGAPLTTVQPIAVQPLSIIRGPDGYLFSGVVSSVGGVLAVPDTGAPSMMSLGTSMGFPLLTRRAALDAALLDVVAGAPSFRGVALDGTLAPSAMPLPMYGGSMQVDPVLLAVPSGYRLIGLASSGELLVTELDPSGTVTSGPTPFTAPQSVTASLPMSGVATAGRELVVLPLFSSGATTYRLVHTCR